MALNIPTGFSFVSQELKATYRPRSWYVTYGVDSPPTSSLALDLRTFFADAWASMLDTSVTIGLCRVRDNNVVAEQGGTTLGTRAMDSVTPNVAVLIEKRTANVGRAHRGRMFLPACLSTSGDVSEDGTLTPARVSALQAAATGWYDRMTTNAHDMVILHSSTVALTPTAVTSLGIDPLVSTQRRRLR